MVMHLVEGTGLWLVCDISYDYHNCIIVNDSRHNHCYKSCCKNRSQNDRRSLKHGSIFFIQFTKLRKKLIFYNLVCL